MEKDGLKEPNHLFIVGCYRSGTTLLRQVLNLHEKIWISKETRFLLRYDLKREFVDTALACRYVNKILQRERWARFLDKQEMVRCFGRICKMRDLYERTMWLESEDKQVWVVGDNTPRYVYLLYWLRKWFPGCRFVFMLRDPRDVCASMQDVRFGSGHPMVVGNEWVDRLRIWREFQAAVSGVGTLTIHYESFVAEPEKEVSRLLSFLGLQGASQIVNSFQSQRASCDIRLAHHANLRRPINVDSIGRFRMKLTNRDLTLVEKVAGNTMIKEGYSPDTIGRPDGLSNVQHPWLLSKASERYQRWLKRVESSLNGIRVRRRK